ncbi:hypothetical protein SO802_030414 [Lithocarpus litseifolius]|uniref:RNase H type-1 domain-containing protein n=1 Tax=Lithocarpus litseifolius TaxID=425828 RepID=A0AAW2BIS7_9ROSI
MGSASPIAFYYIRYCFWGQDEDNSVMLILTFSDKGGLKVGLLGKLTESGLEDTLERLGLLLSVATALWAIRDGINLCLSLNLPAVEIELDAKLVVDLLSKTTASFNAIDIIMVDCKDGFSRIPLVKIQHCYREANKCV